MLTLLSRSIFLLLDIARRRGRVAGAQRAAPGSARAGSEQSEIAKMEAAAASPARPALRLVPAARPGSPERDAAVAAEAWRRAPFFAPGASSFIAGEGARLYSLDTFRSLRGGPRGPGPSHSPHAA